MSELSAYLVGFQSTSLIDETHHSLSEALEVYGATQAKLILAVAS